MAFDKTHFPPIGGQSARGKAPQLFAYQSADDDLAGIKASGYFDEVANMLEAGDVILFIDVGAAVDIVTVAAVTSGVVTTETNDINSA